MNVFYDNIVFQLQQAGGISTYWSELIKRSIRDGLSFKYIHQVNSNIAAANLEIEAKDVYASIGEPINVRRFINPKLSNINEPFIFHSSYNRICRNKKAINVVTAHDFVHEKFYGGARRLLHCTQKNFAIKSATEIITVSENTKRDLLLFHPYLDEKTIKVIYNGVSDDFFVLDSADDNLKPYLLFVGSREHYKNFNFVIELLKELPGFDLYIVGKPLLKDEEKLLLRSVPGRFKLLNNIDNKSLNLVYNQAFALLYPSSYEGFGIPLLEAMKAGLPFIALNKSSIPEIAGDAGELIDELSIDDFKQALNRIEIARKDYISKGLKRVQLFSWEKCYQETISLYHNLI